MLEEFTCKLYGSKKTSDINELRYLLFCAKKCEAESYQLPPCQHCLLKHVLRANYQTCIWKSCLSLCPVIPSPIGNDWIREDQNKFSIDWMSENLAPDAVLELVPCHCSCSYTPELCSCLFNGLRCRDMCRLKDSDNQANLDEVV